MQYFGIRHWEQDLHWGQLTDCEEHVEKMWGSYKGHVTGGKGTATLRNGAQSPCLPWDDRGNQRLALGNAGRTLFTSKIIPMKGLHVGSAAPVAGWQ